MFFLPQTFVLMYLELLTKTKQHIDKGFLTNVSIDGYHIYTQPSKSSAGGVAVYVNNKLNHFKRDALSILPDDFESIWIEIKNKKGKTSFVGVFIIIPILTLNFPMSMISTQGGGHMSKF